MTGTTDALLKAILATVARQTFPPATVLNIVCPTAGSKKQLAAYNLCDGNTPQGEIVKKTKLDKGSFSRSLSRWIASGIVVRIGSEQYPLHVYSLAEEDMKSVPKK